MSFSFCYRSEMIHRADSRIASREPKVDLILTLKRFRYGQRVAGSNAETQEVSGWYYGGGKARVEAA